MAYKGKVVSGTPVTHSQFANVRGADRKALGTDTVPGPVRGAPLMNHRTVDDFTATSKTFHAGHGDTPGGHNGREQPVPANRVGKKPLLDSPPRDSHQFPNLGARSKAQEVRAHDPSTGLGAKPSGTLARS